MNLSQDSDGSKRMPAVDAGELSVIFKKAASRGLRSAAMHRHSLTYQQKKYLIGMLAVLNIGILSATVAQDNSTRVKEMRTLESIVATQPETKQVVIQPVAEPDVVDTTIEAVKVTPTPTPTSTPKPTTAVAGVSMTRVSGTKTDWLRAAGIPENVWGCADALVTKESGWRVNATNPSSGAYGLPQALPGSKMASAGADWQYNPVTQLRWMAGYVNKYGGWCGALNFQIANGWY